MSALKKELEELRATVAKSDTPDHVKNYLHEQIRIMESAFREYEIVGSRAFVAGTVRLVAESEMHREAAAEAAKTEASSALSKIWKAAVSTGDGYDKVSKLWPLLMGGAALAGHLLGHPQLPHIP